MENLARLCVLELNIEKTAHDGDHCVLSRDHIGIIKGNILTVYYRINMKKSLVIKSDTKFVSARFSENGKIFAVATEEQVRVFYGGRLRCFKKLHYPDVYTIKELAVSDKYIAVRVDDGIYLYDLKSRRNILGRADGMALCGSLFARFKKNIIWIYRGGGKTWKLIKKIIGENRIYNSISINVSGIGSFVTDGGLIHSCNLLVKGGSPTVYTGTYGQCKVITSRDVMIVYSSSGFWYYVWYMGRWRLKGEKIAIKSCMDLDISDADFLLSSDGKIKFGRLI